MCGIFGMIGGATDEALERAQRVLAHRGPDAKGSWRAGDVGLAHTRLKVIDLSEDAAQPMVGCRGDVRVTFNGEIYNHRALRSELEQKGHQFRSRSDTEVIVHGYEEWGDDVVGRLDGMFAFGIWDGRTNRLLLARDRAGKKPLFFCERKDQFMFASEIKALLAAGGQPEINLRALPFYLAWGYVPAPQTFYQGIRQLAPASYLTFRRSNQVSDICSYWQPPFLEQPLSDESELTTQTRQHVVRAVERRLESDVPLGAFLSGGIDSTVIVGILTRLLGRKVRTFSIGFAGDARFDETAPARRTAQQFGTEHTEFTLTPASLHQVEKLVWLHDGPFADSSALPTYQLCDLTRQHVTVALSGDGGDELFAGYLRFLAAEANERMPAFLGRGAHRLARLLPGGLPHHSLGARARRFLIAAGEPLARRLARYQSPFALDLADVMRPEMQAQTDIDAPLAWSASFLSCDNNASLLAQLLYHNFKTYLPYDLLVKTDRCSAGVGLEVRSPFLDTELVNFAARLPDSRKRRLGRTKVILRQAFADLIPPEIMTRGKMGFAVPLATWFRGPLRAMLGDRLAAGARLHQYIRSDTTTRLLREHLSGQFDHSQALWTLLTLEVWLSSGLVGNAMDPTEIAGVV